MNFTFKILLFDVDMFYLIFPMFICITSHFKVTHQHCIKAKQPTSNQHGRSVSAGGPYSLKAVFFPCSGKYQSQALFPSPSFRLLGFLLVSRAEHMQQVSSSFSDHLELPVAAVQSKTSDGFMIYWQVAKLESLCQSYSLSYFFIPEQKLKVKQRKKALKVVIFSVNWGSIDISQMNMTID